MKIDIEKVDGNNKVKIHYERKEIRTQVCKFKLCSLKRSGQEPPITL